MSSSARRALLSLAIACFALSSLPSSAQTLADPAFVVRKVASLNFATGMQFTASGDRLFVNERSGAIRVVARGRLLPKPFAVVNTRSTGEAGLLGLALHPDFEHGRPWVYVFYTRSDGAYDRVVRFRANGNRSSRVEVVIDNLPAGFYHHGGIVAFGPDKKLYVSNGEAHDSQKAQDPNVLGGKIYRLNDDGSIPRDNPFRGEPTFSYGHRNPFGLAFDPRTGRLWETENGPDNHDEVNLIRRGGNYGWPNARGYVRGSRYVNPVRDYVGIIVPTMMAFGGAGMGRAYKDDLFFGTFQQGAIHRLTLTARRDSVARDRIFLRQNGVVGMTSGPDGLYYSTPTALYRVSPKSARASSSPSVSASPSVSPAGSPPAQPGGSSAPLFALIGVIAAGLLATIALLVRRAKS